VNHKKAQFAAYALRLLVVHSRRSGGIPGSMCASSRDCKCGRDVASTHQFQFRPGLCLHSLLLDSPAALSH